LNNRFNIFDQKPFHPYHVKLVLACCILHNWILGFSLDELVLDEEDVQPDDIDVGHGVESTNNAAWKNNMMEWEEAMWEDRSHVAI
jgi:hypothetical protein